MTKKIITCHFDERSEEKSSLHQAKDFSLSLEMTKGMMGGRND